MEAHNSEEEPVAKRLRLEHDYCLEPPNAEQIIHNLQQVIENLRAEISSKNKIIQEFEDQVKQKNLESLPNECLLKILSYLSNYNVLRNVAGVSKRFYELSQDQHLLRKIEVESETWTTIQEGKYWEDVLKVLKRSLKLTFLSFDFGKDMSDHKGDKFLEALPVMNHRFLKELCLKGDGRGELWRASEFLDHPNDLSQNLLKYLEKCTNLKVVKFEFKPRTAEFDDWLCHPFLSWIQETISSFKQKNLEELYLDGLNIDLDKPTFKKLLETIAENMPKLQFLCLTADVEDPSEHGAEWPEYAEICQEFAGRQNIKLEIRDVPVLCNFDGGVKSICCGHYKVHPSKVVRICGPKK